jgi:YgiT-type zinc finger domain-containing protein
MRCVICKQGETSLRTTTITLERDQLILVVKSIPAEVCENCGEAYLDERIAAHILESAEDAASAGVRVEVREYVAA